MNRQIGVGDSKNVIVFHSLLTGHVIRRTRSGRVRIFNGNQWETLSFITQERIGVGASNLVGIIDVITRNSWTNSRRVFKLGGRFGHVTRHVWQLLKVKRSKVKVTRSRDVSPDKNAVTRQWMVISTSNLVEIINVGVDACGILSRSVGQTNRK